MRHKNSQRYSEKLRNPRWQKLRLQIFERDKFYCQSCGNPDKELQVHHRAYVNGSEPWEYPPENLVTVCEDCHKAITNLKRDIGWSLDDPLYFEVISTAHKLMTGTLADEFYAIVSCLRYKSAEEIRYAAKIINLISDWSAYSFLQGHGFSAQEQSTQNDHPNSNTGTTP